MLCDVTASARPRGRRRRAAPAQGGGFANELDELAPRAFVAPCDAELTAILERIVRRTAKALVGCDEAESEADAFAALQAAEVERRPRFPDPFKHSRRSAFLEGFSLHAGVRIHAHDREGLERFCRYAVRPPFALQRLSRGDDGRLVYRMKRPRGGSLWLLLARQAHRPARDTRAAAAGSRGPVPRSLRPQLPWAELLKKVFAIDVLACPDCGGRLKLIAFIAEATVACRILDHLGVDSQGPPVASPPPPPELFDPGPDYDVPYDVPDPSFTD